MLKDEQKIFIDTLKKRYGKSCSLGITDIVYKNNENYEKISSLFTTGLSIEYAQGILSTVKVLHNSDDSIFDNISNNIEYRVIVMFPHYLNILPNNRIFMGIPNQYIQITRGINQSSLNTSLLDYIMNDDNYIRSEFIYGYLRYRNNKLIELTINPYFNINKTYDINKLINDTESTNNLSFIKSINFDYTKLHLNLSSEEIEYLIDTYNNIYEMIENLEIAKYSPDFKTALALLSTIEQLLNSEGIIVNDNHHHLSLIK